MNKKTRLLCLTGSWLVLAVFLMGSKIEDYGFKKTTWGVAETTKRKWLKDKTTPEIKVIMKKMAADIGVKCSYCHNESDYASEEKPMKDFARTKMGLVQWLNVKYRPAGADWDYSCYTCHHGKVKPVASGLPGAPMLTKPDGKF